MKRASLIIMVILVFAAAGTVTALTLSGVISFGELRAKNMDIQPSVPPETGSLIDTLSESNFQIDEDGNYLIPSMLAFGDPAVAAISANDPGTEWAYGVVGVTGAGRWVDSHPVEDPTGAACAVIAPWDWEFGGEVIFTSSIKYQPLAYTIWPGSGSCVITEQHGNVASCKVEPYSSNGVKITALDANGQTASLPANTIAEWQAGFTALDFHRYSCGIMRDPSTDTADILEWKLASIDADRESEDQYFVFVTDEDGEWFNVEALCDSSACLTEGHYPGIQIAWFVWRVEE